MPNNQFNETSLTVNSGEIIRWPEVLNTIEVGVTVISPDLRLEYINDTYRQIVDIPSSIVHGCAAFDLYHHVASRGDFGEGEPERQANEKLKAIAGGEWSDAVQIMANDRVVKIRRENLANGYIITTITDITEIRRGQQKISKNEALLTSVLDATDQGIMIVDDSGVVELMNQACAGMFEFPNISDKNPETYFDLMSGAWQAGKFHGERINNLDEDAFFAGTMKIVRESLNNPQILILNSGKYIRFSSRLLAGDRTIFTFTDVTDVKIRELESSAAKLKSENSLADFDTAINNMEVGLVLLDVDLSVLLINNAFHAIWNTDHENIGEGVNFKALMDVNRNNGIYDVEDDEWEDYVEGRMAEVRAGNIEAREFVRADGKTLIYSCTALSDGKRLVRYSDITEYKQREEALKIAQLQAESADRSKSEFLANMSHEIRTPMNGVMGMAELLLKSDLNAKQKMFSDVILSSSTALLTIINDILDFSKIEAGKLEIDPAPFCLATSIQDVTTLLSTNAAEKDLELIVRMQPDLPDYIIGDVGRIRQVLTNLIGNAVKFTEDGHVLVDISGTAEDGMLDLNIMVKDTGIGIPADHQENIFKKFSQVDASSTRRHEGTGLGLAITSRLVELMGGQLGFESEEGEGSLFWMSISLPVEKTVAKKSALPVNIGGTRILVIDDNQVNRSILLEQLESWGLDGASAASGLEGMAKLRQSANSGKPIEVVVLDYHMPDMNGIDVARLMRRDDAMKSVPIVMLTSVDSIGESAEFKELDIEAHLTKPARASQLLDNILLAMEASMSATENTALVDEPTETAAGSSLSPDIVATEESDVRSLIDEAQNVLENDFPDTLVAGDLDFVDKHIDILVAEDNEINQMVFEQILQPLGYPYKIVANGLLAVDELSRSRPAIILMDISMPVMNGHDATREIRRLYGESQSKNSYRPIIIGVTAHALKDDRDKCLGAGMDDYLSKPISPDMLIEKINSWMPRDRGADKIEKIAH